MLGENMNLDSLQINKGSPVLVTGATGYVAGQLIKSLLGLGLTVHAAVRDPDNAEKLKYLNLLAQELEGEIKYFKSDLLEQGSYFDAMQGCEVVFHTASPFTMSVSDPENDLVRPAKQGTRNVLESVNKTPSVKRVVLTSSCAAIYGDNIDVNNTPNGKFTEQVWNTSSTLEHNPYSFSKTVAEREAWDMAKQQSHWQLVVINPSLVIGPGINPYATSESFNIIKQMGNGTMKAGAPRWGMGVVDVRDLAIAHVKAAFLPEAEGRHIISAHSTNFVEMAKVLLPQFGDKYPLPKKALPKWMVWLFGPMMDKSMTRKLISNNVNIDFVADNSKGIEKLGMSYRPLKESMMDFFQQMIDNKQI